MLYNSIEDLHDFLRKEDLEAATEYAAQNDCSIAEACSALDL